MFRSTQPWCSDFRKSIVSLHINKSLRPLKLWILVTSRWPNTAASQPCVPWLTRFSVCFHVGWIYRLGILVSHNQAVGVHLFTTVGCCRACHTCDKRVVQYSTLIVILKWFSGRAPSYRGQGESHHHQWNIPTRTASSLRLPRLFHHLFDLTSSFFSTSWP